MILDWRTNDPPLPDARCYDHETGQRVYYVRRYCTRTHALVRLAVGDGGRVVLGPDGDLSVITETRRLVIDWLPDDDGAPPPELEAA
jgi:hypothetical protein